MAPMHVTLCITYMPVSSDAGVVEKQANFNDRCVLVPEHPSVDQGVVTYESSLEGIKMEPSNQDELHTIPTFLL